MNESPTSSSPSDAVGDQQRQQAVDRLCEAFADDRLEVEEFERRVELAHRAGTAHELDRLLADLPAPKAPARREPPRAATELPALRPSGPHPTQDPRTVPAISFAVGIMGGAARKGNWRPARTNYAVGCMGGFELDFREAILPPGVTEVRVLAFWGGGDIVVPPDVAVEVSVMGIMGGAEETHDAPSNPGPDDPVIRITGVAIMGGCEVNVRYPGESKRDAKRRRREERRERKRLSRGGE